ncbi:hypothetical protein AVEN_127537-1 [Araneus ventricosus]|uniref:PiggyBac transposable element-derived protein domain-containing protein n=1 Tax=Araneus ventricosus TaxID=182803 RepID=A0A4Y2HR01_ARAVE|nr:hypothetical protein AVEN_127537-1 [Araneus ventricosus]
MKEWYAILADTVVRCTRKSKPVKFGYKLWMLTSYNGHPFNVFPYQGAQEKCKEPLSQRVVEALLYVVKIISFTGYIWIHRIYSFYFTWVNGSFATKRNLCQWDFSR